MLRQEEQRQGFAISNTVGLGWGLRVMCITCYIREHRGSESEFRVLVWD
jgi:hypothetical protein